MMTTNNSNDSNLDKFDKKVSLRKKKGSYSISVVSEMFGVHQQTIRLYEKEGLISPSRSSGNTRKFTEEDVAQLEEVIYLTHKLGVNLAGVGMILKLKKKVKKMQDEMNALFDKAKAHLDQESLALKEDSQKKLDELIQKKKGGAGTSNSDVKSRLMQKLITVEQDQNDDE